MNKALGTTLVFGGQAGSEGKGGVVGFLALRQFYSAAICSFMTNAGHTWIGADGQKIVVQQLPMAMVNPEIPLLLIAPGSAITISQLEKELNEFDDMGYDVSSRLRIHPNAMIIEQEDVDYEQMYSRRNGSTAKGCGHALSRKMLRHHSVRLAKDVPSLSQFIADTTAIVNGFLDHNEAVMIEGSQGFDLDLNHGIEYPYVTSRGTTPMQTLADCGIAGSRVATTIATIRRYPIRISNAYQNFEGVEVVGNSGPMGGAELTWEEITTRSGSPVPITEITTVTKRTRRVFEIDWQRLRQMVAITRPTCIALTFADYIDYKVHDKSHWNDLTQPVKDFVDTVYNELQVGVRFIKTGAADESMITPWRIYQLP